MKKILVVVAVMGIALFAASTASARIQNSKHDLSTTSSASIHASNGGLSSCQFCHTPHLRTNPVVNGAPLWNRTLPADSVYRVYGSAATNQTGTTISGSTVFAPGPNSKTCLSCHDGTLSLANVLVGSNLPTSFNDPAGVLVGNAIANGNNYIQTDLRQEHPVGVTYDSTRTLAGLNATVDANGFVATYWKIYGGGNQVGRVECGSCHDPHGNDSVAGGANAPFLKGPKASICSDCHSAK